MNKLPRRAIHTSTSWCPDRMPSRKACCSKMQAVSFPQGFLVKCDGCLRQEFRLDDYNGIFWPYNCMNP